MWTKSITKYLAKMVQWLISGTPFCCNITVWPAIPYNSCPWLHTHNRRQEVGDSRPDYCYKLYTSHMHSFSTQTQCYTCKLSTWPNHTLTQSSIAATSILNPEEPKEISTALMYSRFMVGLVRKLQRTLSNVFPRSYKEHAEVVRMGRKALVKYTSLRLLQKLEMAFVKTQSTWKTG